MFIHESCCLLAVYQRGFKKACSTTDYLVRHENTAREAFIHEQHCPEVFFDMEKAYDTTLKFGIVDLGMKDVFCLTIHCDCISVQVC